MAATPPNLQASGDIRPCRFVKISGEFLCAECDATDDPIGISQEGSRVAPIPDVSTILAAASGDTLRIFGEGEECLLELGSGGATAGNRLKPDADGKGVVASTNNDKYGAQALQTGAAGEKIRVSVTRGFIGA